MERLIAKVGLVPSIDGKFFDKLCMLLPTLLHHRLPLANKNCGKGLYRLTPWHLYGLCRLMLEFLKVTLDLRPCLCIA
jgi:hypothetical protein